MTDSPSTDVADAKFKIWLAEDGTELGRESLDPEHVPFLNDDGNLVIPHQSLKFKKGPKVAEKGYRIFLGPVADGETPVDYSDVKTIDIPAVSAEIRTKGRQPRGSYKNKDDDTVVPFQAPAVSRDDLKMIFLDKDGNEFAREPLGTRRSRKGCHRDADDNVVVPWHVTAGTEAPAVETPEAPANPVVAEQNAPPVEVVEEPADIV